MTGPSWDVRFSVVKQEFPECGSRLFSVHVDEGWRSYVLCTDMYEDKAEWLADVLNRASLGAEALPVWS